MATSSDSKLETKKIFFLQFRNLEQELDKFGFDTAEKMSVYTSLAVVLHLGNITFQVNFHIYRVTRYTWPCISGTL